tara:strand:- start:757 stop:1074 length:318 start_codon:yes stop_codon:yes gene_type:complete
MSKLEQLLKDVEDADAAEGHVLEEWKDDPLHLDADAAWEASMVVSIKAKKALYAYRREKRMSYQTTKKQKYKKLRFLLNKAGEMLDNLYTAHLEDKRKREKEKSE